LGLAGSGNDSNTCKLDTFDKECIEKKISKKNTLGYLLRGKLRKIIVGLDCVHALSVVG
jgi:hypothetical protein